jgi:hypothetical protein
VLEELPTIYFLIGGYWYQADPLDYILRNSFICQICISRSPTDQFILGAAFLRNYYIAHDLNTLQIGLTPHSLSSKPPIIKGSPPSKYGWGRLPQVLQMVGESLVAAAISYFIYG